MISSIVRKLTLLFASTAFLILLITFSLWGLLKEQEQTKKDLEDIMQIQLSVDLLRSQLWIFLQYSDVSSLDQVDIAQQSLSKRLLNHKMMGKHIENLQRMNSSLSVLLKQEKKLTNQYHEEKINSLISAKGLLHSRYNMLVQNMTEELFYLQKSVLAKSIESQQMTLMLSALKILFFSILVSGIAWLILKRFKRGFASIKQGILALTYGDLESKIEPVNLDIEFVALADFFNHMKVSLKTTTVTKDELQLEVERQTSELKIQKDQLQFLSEHDSLTGLLNRRAFEKLLDNAIVKANRTKVKLALLFIDLDNFKTINDTQGHCAGDEILKQIAIRLEASIRQSDFAARLGGDEFVVCLDLIDEYDFVAEKVKQIIKCLGLPIEFEGQSLTVGVSVGISYFPLQTNSMHHLMALADEAMYQAKEVVGNTYCQNIDPLRGVFTVEDVVS
ncbi:MULTISPECIES: diguanylate cyclase domain-containing protein [Vibrio]|uniref:Diguanylate cyclase n=1 Tax=Vibrio anguillarum TaxID=55601 RepID=A0ABD4QYD4_VIBAN|nr:MULTISPECIES: diguanylate cyclase [Vibrio]ASG03888.1 diguanylate cyclase [Vibrio anguillarum]MBT2920243.1 diguanylate cyclase [Vibrio anguillarum]MDQ2192838.1 diguanylate cyclase [Vibrio sp. A14(2019)]MDQ2197933.1 diguanylate cyclase [Vibrio sp. 2017_1457_11]NNN75988.1 diguanylate cyclase [Vibrio sp. B7]